MNDNKRIWGLVAGIIMIMLVFTTMGFVNQRGGVTMKTEYVKDANRTLWKDLIINGSSAAGTSTVYNMGSHSYFGFGYDIAQGTSTPHIRIEWFEGVGIDKESVVWETVPAGTLTASDETSVNPSADTFRPAVAQWVYFKWQGLTNNATNTTFRAWLTRQ